jgi:hypothetical protein
MSYRPGYAFAVASPVAFGDDGKTRERKQTLHQYRFRHRLAKDWVRELDDGEIVIVDAYVDGAVFCTRQLTGEKGFLG